MPFQLSDQHVEEFQRHGFTIFRGMVPSSMISDLRVMAERAQGISRERSGPQAQRLQPVEDFLDIGPYLDLLELPELVDAMGRIFGDGCSGKSSKKYTTGTLRKLANCIILKELIPFVPFSYF